MKCTEIFCDGSAIGNPGPGGWGAVVLLHGRGSDRTVCEYGGFAPHTTNNRMELTAATEALKTLSPGSAVTLKTDSKYVINGATKWVFGWKRNGWMTSQKSEVLNKDLWEALHAETERLTVTWEHVRGHEGIELNERVDMIANGYARKEQVVLFDGDETAYTDFLSTMPKARVVSAGKNKGKAYSYVSLVDGVVMVHATWTECEKRVKGNHAKFKKALSAEDEKALIALWSK